VIEEACQKYACSKGCTVVTADKAMQPIDKVMKQRVLESKAVQSDDTPVAVLDPALPRTRTGRIRT
jgi:transposase